MKLQTEKFLKFNKKKSCTVSFIIKLQNGGTISIPNHRYTCIFLIVPLIQNLSSLHHLRNVFLFITGNSGNYLHSTNMISDAKNSSNGPSKILSMKAVKIDGCSCSLYFKKNLLFLSFYLPGQRNKRVLSLKV